MNAFLTVVFICGIVVPCVAVLTYYATIYLTIDRSGFFAAARRKNCNLCNTMLPGWECGSCGRLG